MLPLTVLPALGGALVEEGLAVLDPDGEAVDDGRSEEEGPVAFGDITRSRIWMSPLFVLLGPISSRI